MKGEIQGGGGRPSDERGDAGYIMDDNARSFLWTRIRTHYEGLKGRRY